MQEVPQPRPHPGEQGPPPHQRRHDRLDQADQERQRKRPEKSEDAVDLDHGADGARLVTPGGCRVGRGRILNLGRGHNDDPGRSQSCPLREVDRGRLRDHQRIEPAQTPYQVETHQQGHSVHRGDIAHHVVLACVELTLIEAPIGNAEHIGGETDGNQSLGSIPIEDLGSRQRRPGALRVRHQRPQGIGPGHGPGPKQPHVSHLGSGRVEQSSERCAPVHSRFVGQRSQGGIPTDHDDTPRPVNLALDRGQRFRDCLRVTGNDGSDDGERRSLLRTIRHRSPFWDRMRDKAISRRCCCREA